MKVICIGKIIVLRDFMSKKIATITQKESVVAIFCVRIPKAFSYNDWNSFVDISLDSRQSVHRTLL